MSKWTLENENKLMLILLAHYSKPGGGPNWGEVAALMGNEFTAGGVSQKWSKQILKRDVFANAKAVFETSGRNGTAKPYHTSPPKKRKLENVSTELIKSECQDQ